jgi:Ca-activated chloride channel family protein
MVSTADNNGDSKVKVEARLSHPVIHAGRQAEIFLRIDVTGLGEMGKRPPLDVAMVLDRSGSMEGEKLAYAKKAVETVIDRLAPTDHVALVAYDSMVDVIFPRRKADDALVMKTKTQLIDAGTCTNLSGGLLEGLHQLGGGEGALRRVFLLTDGLANEGVITPAGLADIAGQGVKRGKGVSTFGVGVDFDEALLRRLADAGAGNYYYISSPDDLPAIFSEELGELGDVVAQNLTLDFNSKVVEILGALGFDESGLPAKAGDIRAGAVRSVMLALAVPTTDEGEVVLGDVTCTWTSLDDAMVQQEKIITVAAIASTDASRVESSVNEEVLRAALLQLAADENQAATRAAMAGDEKAYREHLSKADLSLKELGDTDDLRVLEQRQLHEYMLRCSSADAREDRILLKQAHYSQYNIRRGKPTETERGRGTMRPPKDGPGAGGKGGPGGSGAPGGPNGPNGPDPT